MIYIPRPIVKKSYRVSPMEFVAGTAVEIGTANDIGMDIDKLASGISIAYFDSIASNNSFTYSVHIYTGGSRIFFITNVSQRLGFRIIWQEYI